jgi:hypothetical protein
MTELLESTELYGGEDDENLRVESHRTSNRDRRKCRASNARSRTGI